MKKRKLLMAVPYKARDLEGHSLIGYHLERSHGFEVVYSNSYGIERKLREEAPDVFVTDHLAWDFKIREAELTKRLGMVHVMVSTEGMLRSEESALLVAGWGQGLRQVPGYMPSWGQFHYDARLKNGMITEETGPMCGCPRFDFYVQPLSRLVDSREEFNRKLKVNNSKGKNILWATNTPFANEDFEKFQKRYVDKGNWDPEKILTVLQDRKEQYDRDSAAVREVARRHPDWNFIIKIHPAETVDAYLGFNEPNIRIGYDAPIKDFLINCDVLIQRGCTTATEAWMIDCPVISMELGTYKGTVDPDLLAGSEVVRSTDELETQMQRYLDGGEHSEEQRKVRDDFIRRFYYRIDGESAKRYAEVIAKAASAPRYTDEDQAEKDRRVEQERVEWKRREDKRWINRFKDLIGVDRSQNLRFWKRWGRRKNQGLFQNESEITRAEVEELYRNYDRVLGSVESAAPGTVTSEN